MFDLIIIGSGPAGYYAAELSKNNNLKTAIIEKENFGGVCLNIGCIPSKSFLHTSKIYNYIKKADNYGINIDNFSFSQKKIVERKNKKVDILIKGVKNKVKKAGVQIFYGEAKILKNKNKIIEISVNNKIIKAKNLIIATGSSPYIPKQIIGLKDAYKNNKVLTNKEILSIEEIPKKLSIIGGGAIGLEMADYFSTMGSQVDIIEFSSSIGGNIDKDISLLILEKLKENGINFHLNSKVTKINKNELFFTNKENKEEKIKFNKVLISVGRKPNIENLGLENINLYIQKDKILVDEKCKTNISNIYAIGDVNGNSMLAHTAYREADVAISNIVNKKDKINYDKIPVVIYTNPEVAYIGKKQEELISENIDFDVIKKPLTYAGRFLVENDNFNGLCKIFIEKNTKKILGIHMIGSYSSEIISFASLIIEKELTVDSLKRVVIPHPTVAEIIKELTMFYKEN